MTNVTEALAKAGWFDPLLRKLKAEEERLAALNAQRAAYMAEERKVW
jgi:hypothetical protein